MRSRSDRPDRNASGVKPPQNLAQSYIVTTAMYDFTVYEKRIVYNLIKCAQKELFDMIRSRNLKLRHRTEKNVTVKLPVNACLTGSDDKNHSRIKEAMESLTRKTITYSNGDTWNCYSLLPSSSLDEKTCIMTLEIHRDVWDALRNLSMGYSEYDYNVAFSLQSPYSMRLYELLCSQSEPITYSIGKIRDMFVLKDKYAKTKDLIHRVVEQAQKELDEKSPVSFTFTRILTGRKVTAIRFTPVRKEPLKEFSLPEGVDLFNLEENYTGEELDLLYSFGFDTNGIRNNSYLFLVYKQECGDFAADRRELKDRASAKDSPCGWLVRTLEGRLHDLEKNHRI